VTITIQSLVFLFVLPY